VTLLLKEKRPLLDKLAFELLEKETISGREVIQVLSPAIMDNKF
jgi:ATP-dependent Zn protease